MHSPALDLVVPEVVLILPLQALLAEHAVEEIAATPDTDKRKTCSEISIYSARAMIQIEGTTRRAHRALKKVWQPWPNEVARFKNKDQDLTKPN